MARCTDLEELEIDNYLFTNLTHLEKILEKNRGITKLILNNKETDDYTQIINILDKYINYENITALMDKPITNALFNYLIKRCIHVRHLYIGNSTLAWYRTKIKPIENLDTLERFLICDIKDSYKTDYITNDLNFVDVNSPNIEHIYLNNRYRDISSDKINTVICRNYNDEYYSTITNTVNVTNLILFNIRVSYKFLYSFRSLVRLKLFRIYSTIEDFSLFDKLKSLQIDTIDNSYGDVDRMISTIPTGLIALDLSLPFIFIEYDTIVKFCSRMKSLISLFMIFKVRSFDPYPILISTYRDIKRLKLVMQKYSHEMTHFPDHITADSVTQLYTIFPDYTPPIPTLFELAACKVGNNYKYEPSLTKDVKDRIIYDSYECDIYCDKCRIVSLPYKHKIQISMSKGYVVKMYYCTDCGGQLIT